MLKIFFIGTAPFVKYPKDYCELGGSDFLVMKVLAKRHKFNPNFLPAKSYDIAEANGTKYGLLYQVTERTNKILGPDIFVNFLA